MRLVKILTTLVMSMYLTMCQPAMAEQKPAKIGEISMADCLRADHYISVIYEMAIRGRSTYEIMAYLDEITDVTDREYIGILMTKVNVGNVMLSVKRAYTSKDVVSRHKEICIAQIGNVVNRY